jgi:hypothetical protein
MISPATASRISIPVKKYQVATAMQDVALGGGVLIPVAVVRSVLLFVRVAHFLRLREDAKCITAVVIVLTSGESDSVTQGGISAVLNVLESKQRRAGEFYMLGMQ